jgi:hypothetical protein
MTCRPKFLGVGRRGNPAKFKSLMTSERPNTAGLSLSYCRMIGGAFLLEVVLFAVLIPIRSIMSEAA